MGLAGAARRRAIAQSCVYYFWYLALGATISSLGALLPGIGRQTGATLEQQKYLVPPRATGFGLGSVLGGWLLERADGHRIMAAAAASTTAVNLVMAGASSFSVVLAMQLCYGLLGGCSEVVINTLTIQVWGEDVGPYMQFLHACFAIGAGPPPCPRPPPRQHSPRCLQARCLVRWSWRWSCSSRTAWSPPPSSSSPLSPSPPGTKF